MWKLLDKESAKRVATASSVFSGVPGVITFITGLVDGLSASEISARVLFFAFLGALAFSVVAFTGNQWSRWRDRVVRKGSIETKGQKAIPVEAANAASAEANDRGAQPAKPIQSAGKVNASVYLHPLDRDKLVLQWQSPARLDNADVVLDFRPSSDGKVRRIPISAPPKLTTGENRKTEIAHTDKLGSWRWSLGSKEIMHKGSMACRLTIIASDGGEHHWRFAIADRASREAPRIVGEDLFMRTFD